MIQPTKKDIILGKPMQDTYRLGNTILRMTRSTIWRARYKKSIPTIDHLRVCVAEDHDVTYKKRYYWENQCRTHTASQPSATCVLNIALPTRDGCDIF